MFSAHNKNVHTRPNRVPEFNYMLYPISLDETKKKRRKIIIHTQKRVGNLCVYE